MKGPGSGIAGGITLVDVVVLVGAAARMKLLFDRGAVSSRCPQSRPVEHVTPNFLAGRVESFQLSRRWGRR